MILFLSLMLSSLVTFYYVLQGCNLIEAYKRLFIVLLVEKLMVTEQEKRTEQQVYELCEDGTDIGRGAPGVTDGD